MTTTKTHLLPTRHIRRVLLIEKNGTGMTRIEKNGTGIALVEKDGTGISGDPGS